MTVETDVADLVLIDNSLGPAYKQKGAPEGAL
jgi:hypothetical protein